MNVRNGLAGGLRMMKARLAGRAVPLAVSWAVTGRCNLRCLYCDIWRKEFKELTTREALKVIDEMKEAGTRRISLTGGEPLLREDIGRIIRHAKSRSMCVTMNSNGWLVKKRLGDILGLDGLAISIDGPREVHDKQRGKGSYDKAMDAAISGRDAGLDVSFLAVVTRHSVGRLEELIETANALGIGILLQPVEHYAHSGKATTSLLPSRASLENSIRMLMNERSILNSGACLRNFMEPERLSHRNCAAGRIFCRIDPDGSMYPCGRTSNRKDPPNVRGGFLKGFRELEPPLCGGCYCAGLAEANMLFRLDASSIRKALGI
jgi:MoaA/NifB/PqqE/SkfB family radical SAM enzyme